MLDFFANSQGLDCDPITLFFITTNELDLFLSNQSGAAQTWVKQHGFEAKSGQRCSLSNEQGLLQAILIGVGDAIDIHQIVSLPHGLKTAIYQYDFTYASHADSDVSLFSLYLGWGLGLYQFTAYQKERDHCPQLLLDASIETELLEHWLTSISLGRDLINTPCCDMTPEDLEGAVLQVAEECQADCHVITGEALLENNYPAIYAVGKGAAVSPRLIDLTWGDEKDPKVTLVGKGVCFDTGGLNLKPARGIRQMKKDMGGAAAVLALARMIMLEKWPVRLRLLIPAVENAIGKHSYRPDDVIQTRAGLTVEIDNTDAEGRLVLCDALTEACTEDPDYLVDFATLTGARMVALGDDICAAMSHDQGLAEGLQQYAWQEKDYIWQLPLFTKYAKQLKSSIADCTNSSTTGKGGTITAALYLAKFVPESVKWLHIDTPGAFDNALNGHETGGDVPGIRAMYGYLKQLLAF